MTVTDLLNQSKAAHFFVGDYMVWKHSEGWSVTNINTNEYFRDMEDWDRRKEHVVDSTGKNYWTSLDEMLKQLEKHL